MEGRYVHVYYYIMIFIFRLSMKISVYGVSRVPAISLSSQRFITPFNCFCHMYNVHGLSEKVASNFLTVGGGGGGGVAKIINA